MSGGQVTQGASPSNPEQARSALAFPRRTNYARPRALPHVPPPPPLLAHALLFLATSLSTLLVSDRGGGSLIAHRVPQPKEEAGEVRAARDEARRDGVREARTPTGARITEPGPPPLPTTLQYTGSLSSERRYRGAPRRGDDGGSSPATSQARPAAFFATAIVSWNSRSNWSSAVKRRTRSFTASSSSDRVKLRLVRVSSI